MTAARKAVAAARAQLAKAEEALVQERRRRRILCSCGKYHAIGDLDLLQTHFYIEPHGCTGGDYWKEGELQFVCPKEGTRNRLLFDDYHLDWREHGSTALAFSCAYKRLFKSVRDVHDGSTWEGDWEKTPWHNNYYVDQHRERFELPVKPKKT